MVNWGLVGCGDISNKRVAPAIKSQPKSKLVAAMSPYMEELDSFAVKHNLPKKYLSLDDLLKDKEIDAVYIATPIFLHYRSALQALKSGKHVLVEKPMAMTNGQCEELIAEAKKQNVKFGVAYYRRFFPKLKEVKRLIAEGVIGDVIQVRILYHSWYNPGKDDPKSWRVDKSKSGGGPLWDMACHKFDMLVDILGMPRSVSALMSTLTHSYDVEDSCSVVMELENGAHCLASFNWNSRIWADEFEILGTQGKIVMCPCDSDNLEIQLNQKLIKGLGKEVTSVVMPNHSNVHYPLIDDFAESVLAQKDPMISGLEGYKTNRILTAIEESAKKSSKIYF